MRRIECQDVATFVRRFNAPKVRQYLTIYAPMPKAQNVCWFEAHLEVKDQSLFVVEAQTQDGWIFLGNVGLYRSWNRLGTLRPCHDAGRRGGMI